MSQNCVLYHPRGEEAPASVMTRGRNPICRQHYERLKAIGIDVVKDGGYFLEGEGDQR